MYNKFFEKVRKNREEFGERFNLELATKLRTTREIKHSNENSRRGKEKQHLDIKDDLDTLTDEECYQRKEYDPNEAKQYFSDLENNNGEPEMMEDDEEEEDND